MRNTPNTIVILSLFLFVLTLFQPLPVAAVEWNSADIDDVKNKVTRVHNRVNGSLHPRAVQTLDNLNGALPGTAMYELTSQLRQWDGKGHLLREGVEELREWLEPRFEEYQAFVGDLNEKCMAPSPCYVLREDLKSLFNDFAGLSGKFPIISRVGLDNPDFALRAIDQFPPFIMFGLHEATSRMQDWQQIPAQLSDIFDEIGDPEVFSVDLQPRASDARFKVFAAGQPSPTQRFCEKNKEKVEGGDIDPVRLNRIKDFLFRLTETIDVWVDMLPDDVAITAVGEGTEIPNVLRFPYMLVKLIIDSIQHSVQTYRDNIAICRAQIAQQAMEARVFEGQIAACMQLVEFVLPEGIQNVYEFVRDKIGSAKEQGVLFTSRAEKYLGEGYGLFQSGDYGRAYKKFCRAYSTIGDG